MYFTFTAPKVNALYPLGMDRLTMNTFCAHGHRVRETIIESKISV